MDLPDVRSGELGCATRYRGARVDGFPPVLHNSNTGYIVVGRPPLREHRDSWSTLLQ